MAKMKSLDDLFLHTLKDILYAEKQIMKALPKMARKASADQLRQAFESHREETQGQIERLEKVFDALDKTPRGAKCEAILGIIEEAEEIMEECEDPATLDAALISSAQAVEHYEMTRYGTLARWARELGRGDAAKLLGETLEEEKKADAKLTKLAEKAVNKQAA